MKQQDQSEVATWRRVLAYWWYMWGLSSCYSGNQTLQRPLYTMAVHSFERATRLWPSFARAYYRSGLIRGRELGQYPQALADLGAAIKLEPQWADPYLQRGLFQRFQGDAAAAISDLEQYLRLGHDPYWRREAQRQIEQLHQERLEDEHEL